MSTRILIGDVRERLAELPDRSVHCIVTSPPYFNLRDYGTAQWEGGADGCEHRVWGHAPDKPTPGGRGGSMPKQEVIQREHCHCGARRIDSQIGLEPTPDAYVATLVAVFREARRVLRDDGTAWINLGDAFANKQLLGIPWRVAFALQADGWYLRSNIIWHKPNPMPESVTDRPTSAHEHVFLFAKQARYYYDVEAVKEPGEYCGLQLGIVRGRKIRAHAMMRQPSGNEAPGANAFAPAMRNLRNVWTIASQPYAEAHFATFPPDLVEPCIKAGCPRGGLVLDPFGGAGTTALVADRLGRDCILIELNPAYADLAVRRIERDAGLFAAVTQEAAE